MAKGFGIHGSTTSHGGTVISTQSRSSQMGNLFLRAGDGFACPKCKCWSTLIKSNDHVIFDGKAVAYVGDKFTCGATLLPKQDHVVGDSGLNSTRGTSSLSSIANNFLNKKIFDEQIQLVEDDSFKNFFNYISYSLKVGNKKYEGILDKDGKTERFLSDKAEEITDIEFFFNDEITYFYELDKDK